MEILPNIQINYPEYSLITPQTLQEFTIRSLSVQEEENFKASILTPNQFADHLNKIIWNCLVKKPESIKTYDDFENNISVKDRDALLYGLYHISYKDISDYDVTCQNCGKSFPVKIDISKCFSINRYIPTGEDVILDKMQNEKIEYENKKPETITENREVIVKHDKPTPAVDNFELIKKRIKLRLKVASNIIVYIKQPLLRDERLLSQDPLFQSTKQQDIGTELLVIDHVEILNDSKNENDRSKIIIKEKDNLSILYKKLPSQDRKMINESFIENFAKYGIELKVVSRCISCGEEAETNIDLVSQFFRSLY